MRKRGKLRWVEKTPDHLPFVKLIRRWFPKSPVIRLVRDPRDVVLSLTAMPWGPASMLEAAVKLREYHLQSDAFFRTDDYCYTVRFEDLVTAPEHEVRAICTFIGESFEIGMLDRKGAMDSVNRTNEPWKMKIETALDASRVGAWVGRLQPSKSRLIEALTGDMMRQWRYAQDEPFAGYCDVYPLRELPEHEGLFQSLTELGLRFWPLARTERPSRAIYLGSPNADYWLGHETCERVGKAARVVLHLAYCLLTGIPTSWCASDGGGEATGMCERLVTAALSSMARTKCRPWPRTARA
jgi:hypothetical protein